MTATHTTDGIRALQALPSPQDGPDAWRIAFRSDHAGWHHQLYVNGRLAASSDSPAQRSFLLQAAAGPQAVAVVACPPHLRLAEAPVALGLAVESQRWIWSAKAVRLAGHDADSRLEVVDQTGLVRFSADLQPAGASDWTFGHDAFGCGGFGYDGSLAAGLGQGAWGAGEFGFDAPTRDIRVELLEEGTHELTVRTVRGDSSASRAPIIVLAAPPPSPAAGLTLASYDPLNDRVLFTIWKG